MMVRGVSTAGVACLLAFSAGAAEETSSPVDTSKSTPSKDLFLKADPGLLGERLKLPPKTTDLPIGPAPTGEPSISRKEMLRLRDRQEEKQNWMFVKPGQLTEDREKRDEENYLKDKWEMKEDLKKKGWWEYGSKDDKSGAAGHKAGDKPDRDQAELQLRTQRDQEDKGFLDKGRSISSGMALGKSKETGESAHQASELNLKDLFTGGSDSRASKDSDSGSIGLFSNTDASSRQDRETAQSRRQEFRDFLNTSRTSGSGSGNSSGSDASSPVSSPIGSGTLTTAGSSLNWLDNSSTRIQARESSSFSSPSAASSSSPSDFGRAPGASSSPFSGFTDSSRGGAGGFNSGFQSSQPSYRSSYDSSATRSMITPQMMAPPKRRF